MSKNMPYYAIDKVAATISLDAKARVKWENRANASEDGEGVTTFIAKFLEKVVRDDPFTLDDAKRAQAYMEKNAAAREKRKAKKGIK